MTKNYKSTTKLNKLINADTPKTLKKGRKNKTNNIIAPKHLIK